MPYLEVRQFEKEKIQNDVQRLMSVFSNVKEFKELNDYLKTGVIDYNSEATLKHNITGGERKNYSRAVAGVKVMKKGLIEKSIIKVPSDHYKMLHPTQKPVRLMERLIALVSNKNDLILDPFMGSASTGLACLNTGRRFIGCEIDDEYYKISCDRVAKAMEEKSEDVAVGV